jgi:hypothetical protein
MGREIFRALLLVNLQKVPDGPPRKRQKTDMDDRAPTFKNGKGRQLWILLIKYNFTNLKLSPIIQVNDNAPNDVIHLSTIFRKLILTHRPITY